MSRQATPVILSETDRQELEQWVRAHRTPQQVVQRCQIVLAAAQGRQDKAIAADLEINFKTVALWRSRFCQEGTEGLWEVAPGRGRKPRYAASKIKTIIDATLQTRPAGATHWSCRSLAKKQGVSKATKRVVVVMDEFQEIFDYPSSRVERHLRTALQRQREVAYLVLGSRRRLIARMVLEESRPLYRAFTLFNLGLIPAEDWKPFLKERFARKGVQLSAEAFSQVMAVTGGHPYYVQNLCHVIWDAAPFNGSVSLTEVTQARETVLQRESYAFTVIWETLTANQRKFLKALAADPGRKVKYLSADFIQHSGLKAAANVQRAMNSLIDRDLVDRSEGTCNIVDPWFRLWVSWRT